MNVIGIFAHIPKTGGSTINAWKDHGVLSHGHLPLYRLKKKSTANFLHKVPTFSMVRNPWDRLISAFFYQNGRSLEDSTDLEKIADFQRWLLLETSKKNAGIHWVGKLPFPGVEEMLSHKGRVWVDYVGRFEKFTESLRDIVKLLKKPDLPVDIPMRNIGKSRPDIPYQDFYDQKHSDWIRKHCAFEIETFDYTFR